jgi:general secretion pathway protein B
MSYILDALRKADAERELGRVPGLNAQPLPNAAAGIDRFDEDDDAASAERRQSASRWWPLAAGAALAAVGLGAAGWTMLRGAEPAVPLVAATPPVPAPAPPPVPPAPSPTPATPEPAAPRAATASPAPAAAPNRSEPRPEPRQAPVRPAPRPAAAAVPPLEALEPGVRAGLPTFSVGGAVYSRDPASRMLIINGVISREGDALAGGVMLERIGPRLAVLRRDDVRFSIRY